MLGGEFSFSYFLGFSFFFLLQISVFGGILVLSLFLVLIGQADGEGGF